ncbi:hypothetical protein [Pedobacter roseus]|uniref:Signal peptidase n=1 Tax=Pedobacter roseus TaxID=336820 RepID=A0A7G9QK89_9SPHI|nr:hypothetical protein [Pedobacter roseus]QNN43764.1 hypothetical protein H9L23_06655 [Pedobacter roseus]
MWFYLKRLFVLLLLLLMICYVFNTFAAPIKATASSDPAGESICLGSFDGGFIFFAVALTIIAVVRIRKT